ncbi:MAG: lactate dehydrogenase [Tindallia sp. MSAO_Bac2]|nr:MAG: lactate dehydrogenase [Tindallia sp. MSAO_Bac2]
MLYFHKMNGCVIVSDQQETNLESVSEQEPGTTKHPIYWVVRRNPLRSNVCSAVTEPWQLIAEEESLSLIEKEGDLNPDQQTLLRNILEEMPWIPDKINSCQLYTLNVNHPRWHERVGHPLISGGRVHIAGLGDVGGTLLTGLRMQGLNQISSIGIFDLSTDKMNRWEQEANQISDLNYTQFPVVEPIVEDDIFNCDVFVFCVAKHIPELNSKVSDVRMAQLEANAHIIRIYAQKAREAGFKGLFAVVSDPVDQLCKIAYESSNYNEMGEFDFEGLFPEQVKGFGLGVMNARANYYASRDNRSVHYQREGRAFGPHGQGLFILDSVVQYNETISRELTQQTLTANLAVRKSGYKPYIAPALSSGCYSILSAMDGSWHYSTVFLGGVYFGCRNQIKTYGQAWETYSLPESVMDILQNTWRKLDEVK